MSSAPWLRFGSTGRLVLFAPAGRGLLATGEASPARRASETRGPAHSGVAPQRGAGRLHACFLRPSGAEGPRAGFHGFRSAPAARCSTRGYIPPPLRGARQRPEFELVAPTCVGLGERNRGRSCPGRYRVPVRRRQSCRWCWARQDCRAHPDLEPIIQLAFISLRNSAIEVGGFRRKTGGATGTSTVSTVRVPSLRVATTAKVVNAGLAFAEGFTQITPRISHRVCTQLVRSQSIVAATFRAAIESWSVSTGSGPVP